MVVNQQGTPLYGNPIDPRLLVNNQQVLADASTPQVLDSHEDS